MALSSWEKVESFASTLFTVFMQGSYPAAERVFGTIVSNSGKRAALAAAAEVDFFTRKVSDEDKKAFELLVQHYEYGGGRRTEIAHGVVINAEMDGVNGYFLMPPHYNTKKTDLWSTALAKNKEGIDAFGHYRYTSEDIKHFRTRFSSLSSWVFEYVADYVKKYPLKP